MNILLQQMYNNKVGKCTTERVSRENKFKLPVTLNPENIFSRNEGKITGPEGV